jgi:hypothetical protein
MSSETVQETIYFTLPDRSKVNLEHHRVGNVDVFLLDGEQVPQIVYEASKSACYGQMPNVAQMAREKGDL